MFHTTSPRKDSRGDYAPSTLPKRPMPAPRPGEATFPPPYDIQPYDVLDGNLDPLLQANNNTLVGSPRRIRPVQTMPVSHNSSGSDMSHDELAKMVSELQTKLKRIKDSVGYHDQQVEESIYERIDDGMKYKRREQKKPQQRRYSVKRHATNRGLYRLKFLIDPDVNICSRVVLGVLLTLCLALFAYQTSEHLRKFLRSPSYTSIDVAAVHSLIFPAVTICNLNPFKLTSVINLNMYDVINSINQHKQPLSLLQSTSEFRRLGMTYKDFLKKVSHQKRDIINSCHWQEGRCTWANLSETYTDSELCYTLQAQSPTVYHPGAANGLYLVINVEQYEYLLGPRSSVGVRVFVHDVTVPLKSSSGVEIPVGKHTSIEIRKQRTINLGPTSSHCSGLAYWWHASCRQRCQKRFTCDCDKYNGVPITVAEAQRSERQRCECPSDCDKTEYKLFVSHAGMPAYGAVSMRKSLEERRALEAKIKKARDVYHRVDSNIHSHDAATLRTISNNLAQSTTNASTFVKQVERQESETRKLSGYLLEAVTKLNLNLGKNHNAFAQSGHVSFIYLVPQVRTKMDEVAETSKIFSAVSSTTKDDKLKAIREIVIVLVQLVKTNEAWYKQEPLLDEISKGLRTFNKEVIAGYSKNYREFKSNKLFYEQKVNRTLILTTELAGVLSRGYYLVKNASQQLETSNRLADVYLETFDRKIVPTAGRYLTQMSKELTEFSEKYRFHKNKVLELGKNLSTVAMSMTRSFDNVKTGLHSLKGLAVKLNSTIEHFSAIMMAVTNEYGNRSFGKTELSGKLQDNRILTGLEDTMSMTQNISTVGARIEDEGRFLSDSLESIAERLIDFNLASRHVIDEQKRWLTFNSLHTELASFWQNVQATLQLLASYQAEIDDFSRGNKLDEEFYRNNFLQLELYYPQMTETVVEERMAYGLFDLTCDLGGALALYLGASLLTAFDLLDFILCVLRRPFASANNK